MAELTGKAVSELPEATNAQDSDLLAISQNATSKKVTVETLLKLASPIIVQKSEDTNFERKILIKDGNLMHLHYERLAPVPNGTNVNGIPAQYAPSISVSGSDWYYQNSGIGRVNCYVLTNGTVRMSAQTYDEPVAGVFDIYWTI